MCIKIYVDRAVHTSNLACIALSTKKGGILMTEDTSLIYM